MKVTNVCSYVELWAMQDHPFNSSNNKRKRIRRTVITLYVDGITDDHQRGFWRNRSVTYQIFCIRQIAEKNCNTVGHYISCYMLQESLSFSNVPARCEHILYLPQVCRNTFHGACCTMWHSLIWKEVMTGLCVFDGHASVRGHGTTHCARCNRRLQRDFRCLTPTNITPPHPLTLWSSKLVQITFKNSVITTKKTRRVSVTNIGWLPLRTKIIAVALSYETNKYPLCKMQNCWLWRHVSLPLGVSDTVW